jgi:hypothetical protein
MMYSRILWYSYNIILFHIQKSCEERITSDSFKKTSVYIRGACKELRINFFNGGLYLSIISDTAKSRNVVHVFLNYDLEVTDRRMFGGLIIVT